MDPCRRQSVAEAEGLEGLAFRSWPLACSELLHLRWPQEYCPQSDEMIQAADTHRAPTGAGCCSVQMKEADDKK